MRLFFFPSQEASESKPEEATAPLITAAPMRFKASRRVILLSSFISLILKYYCNLLSVAKVDDTPKSSLTEITGRNAIFTVVFFSLTYKSRSPGRVCRKNGLHGFTFLFRHPDFLQPVLYPVFGAAYTVAGNGIAIKDGRHFLHLADSLDSIRETAAAMRAERNDGLATEIILVKKRIERLGHIVPPVGKPDKHDIVLVQILDVGSQCRTGILVRFLFWLRR